MALYIGLHDIICINYLYKNKENQKKIVQIIRIEYNTSTLFFSTTIMYTQQSRKSKNFKRKAKIAIALFFIAIAYGYVGHQDIEIKQLEASILFSHGITNQNDVGGQTE